MKLPNEHRDTMLYSILSTPPPPGYQTVTAEHWRDGVQVGTITCAASLQGDNITLSFLHSFMAQIGDEVRLPADNVTLTLESVHPVQFKLNRLIIKVVDSDEDTP